MQQVTEEGLFALAGDGILRGDGEHLEPVRVQVDLQVADPPEAPLRQGLVRAVAVGAQLVGGVVERVPGVVQGVVPEGPPAPQPLDRRAVRQHLAGFRPDVLLGLPPEGLRRGPRVHDLLREHAPEAGGVRRLDVVEAPGLGTHAGQHLLHDAPERLPGVPLPADGGPGLDAEGLPVGPQGDTRKCLGEGIVGVVVDADRSLFRSMHIPHHV
mmetsp:Transcript_126557/g.369812  ORF Transcript_126557/g.369812 Transcript_126557/m.369812 type:complete len:212 (-) Transcript_126557:339-974(-)